MARVGVVLPQLEIGCDPGAIREYATAVEALGFTHILAYDHVVGADTARSDARMATWPPGHYTHRDQFHEPLVLFGYLAGITQDIEFTTGVLVLPQRQTALVAKQAAEVAVLSRNRLRLGVGIGYNHLEFEALGVPFERRGERTHEQIAVLKALLRERLVAVDGEFHRLDRVGLNPLPEKSVPIWMGATSAAGFRRAAMLGDGWICPGGALSPTVQGWLGELNAALLQAGPRQKQFGVDGRLDVRFRSDDDIVLEMARWLEVGASHVSVNTMTPYDRRSESLGVDAHLRLLERTRDLIREASDRTVGPAHSR